MASWEELQHFLENGSATRRLREDALLEHLHRATTRTTAWDELVILAFDHRTQLEEIAARHGQGTDGSSAFKRLDRRGRAPRRRRARRRRHHPRRPLR